MRSDCGEYHRLAFHVVPGVYRHYDVPGAYMVVIVGEDETGLVPPWEMCATVGGKMSH